LRKIIYVSILLYFFILGSLIGFMLAPFIHNANANSDTRYIIIEPDIDIDCNWVLYDTTHHDSVIDNNDNTKIRYNKYTSAFIEILGFNTETLLLNEYISQLELYSRGKCWDSPFIRPKFDYYWNNIYQGLNEIVELPVDFYPEWTSNIIIDLNGSQSDLDNLEIKYMAPIFLPFFPSALIQGDITEIYIEVEIILTENGNGIITNWEGIIFFLIMMSMIFIIGFIIAIYFISKEMGN